VRVQTSKISLNLSLLQKRFSDVVLTSSFLDQLKPALVSQNSSFLLGPTGNGKTNIVGRLVRIYLDAVAIPYAVELDRKIIVLYDPVFHDTDETDSGLAPRRVVCRWPFVLLVGEMEPSMLELKMDKTT
jgi:predicted ATPase with chaperone activity